MHALAELGLVIEPVDLGGALQGGPATSSDRSVVVKGGAKKSIQMFSEPGSGSVVAKLPGKMTLSVLEERGGWLKVRTFDGKEGWVEAEEVK